MSGLKEMLKIRCMTCYRVYTIGIPIRFDYGPCPRCAALNHAAPLKEIYNDKSEKLQP